MKRILLVEDERSISTLIKINLELEGYEVVLTESGLKAIDIFHQQRFDLIILVIMLPELNGIEVCEQIRLHDRALPILMLSAKSTSDDRIKGLKTGADDYLTKPFVLEELLLRISKLIQRSKKESGILDTNYKFGESQVNFTTYNAKGPTKSYKLTKKEILLLKLLIEREGQVVSRKEILQAVWGYDIIISTRTVDNFILMLRKYFEKNPAKPVHFISVRGVGYKFNSNE
jgi:two-component system alkaline phosphatase synthesis response regulator PhoP